MKNPDFQPQGSYVRIHVKNMEVQVRIGVHAHEQEHRQRICVNIEMFAALGDYLKNPNLSTIINYDRIYNEILNWAERPHTALIETYLRELAGLCFADSRIEACRISVFKPDIFKDAENVGVEIFMTRADFERLGS